MSRKTFVYDKKLGKVVPIEERTDREPRAGRAPYIKQRFSTRYSLQLGHPSDVKAERPEAGYSSWDDLESKAHARGWQVHTSSEGDIRE